MFSGLPWFYQSKISSQRNKKKKKKKKNISHLLFHLVVSFETNNLIMVA